MAAKHQNLEEKSNMEVEKMKLKRDAGKTNNFEGVLIRLVELCETDKELHDAVCAALRGYAEEAGARAAERWQRIRERARKSRKEKGK